MITSKTAAVLGIGNYRVDEYICGVYKKLHVISRLAQ